MEKNKSILSIDEYISSFPLDVQEKLQMMRKVIKVTAPQATEKISYGMPTFVLFDHNLVHFAAYKNHIGFYPTPSGIDSFKEELSKFKGAKGSVQFPLNEPLPLELVRKIVAFRADENIRLAEEKHKKKK